jgi:NADPH:quinone reductase-like Zn-dependent oxidoreductase
MKAIQFEQYGEPVKVLTVQERPVPEPGKGEVRVRILASPVNPSDLLFVRGHYAGVQPIFPSPVGFEGVGIVDVLGPEVQRLVLDSVSQLLMQRKVATGPTIPSSPLIFCFLYPAIFLMSKSPPS